jgi:type I restriction enzyme S subunit
MSSLPSGWTVKPLGDVATLQRGFDLPVHQRTSGDIPVFAANGPVGTHNVPKVSGPGVVTGRSGTLGEVHYVESDYWPLNTALWVKDFHGNEPKWVARLLKWMRLETHTRGTGVPTLNRNLVHVVPVLVPPLEEQRRIAAILDKADAVRRKRKEAIALTEELLRSAFLEMFGDPVTNPKGWHTKRLGELAQFVGGGTPSRQKAEYYQGDICWATPKDMGVDVLTDTEEHITSEAIEQSATKLVGIDSLLVVVKSKVLGRKLPIARTTVPTCFGQDLKAIIPHEASIQRYLHRHIKYGEKTLLRQARGVNTEGLTLVHLQNYQVMIPSASEVARFVGLDSVLENTRNKQKALWEESINFFNSLLQRAFLGEL